MKTPTLASALLAGLLLATTATAAQPETPQGFLQGVYDRFMIHPPKKSPPDWARGQAGEAFDPVLAGLIRKYTAAADKAQNAGLDFVPFCACNDDSGLHYAIAAKPGVAGKATAAVTVRSDYADVQKPFVLNYDLVQTPAGWRVADIHTKEIASLKALVISNLKSEYHLKP